MCYGRREAINNGGLRNFVSKPVLVMASIPRNQKAYPRPVPIGDPRVMDTSLAPDPSLNFSQYAYIVEEGKPMHEGFPQPMLLS